ncbi:MAG: homoserine dehydrogenase, partial [Planctomycetes bacterium]|nr:homoserine dehydrogenase [Planctomycetota bacterium]
MADIEVMHSYRIGLIGLGTVGLSFAELLTRFGDECSQSCGRSLELRRVVVRDRDRALARWQAALPTVPPPKWTGEVDRVVGADDIDLVVELVGGVDLPREWIRRALKSGQDVVTANKAVLAAHGEELFEIADKFGRSLLFEGAAAGAIPILQVIREGLTAGPITSLQAILNGSTNWLIGALGQGRSMAEALDEARERGLVEADPTLDIAGTDAAHKLALIARLLTGRRVDFAAIRCEGIADLGPEDLAFGCRQGLELRLVAHMSTREPGRAELGVFPEWHAKDHPLASIHDENNAVILEGPTFGSLMFVGRGAGGKPTAGSVMADTVRAARGAGRISSTKQR